MIMASYALALIICDFTDNQNLRIEPNLIMNNKQWLQNANMFWPYSLRKEVYCL